MKEWITRLLTKLRDAKEQHFAYVNLENGRHKKLLRVLADESTAELGCFSYDGNTPTSDGAVSWTLDGAGRVATVSGHEVTVCYEYQHPLGVMTRKRFGSTDLSYAYDTSGYLQTLSDSHSNAVTYTRTPGGVLSSALYSSGIVETYGYTAQLYVSDLTYSKSGTVLASFHADVDGLGRRHSPKVEGALRELQEKGRENKRPFGTTEAVPMTGKSLQNYSEALRSFCLWSVGRGYLESDPLDGLASFDTTPKSTRRALTVLEIKRILDNVENPDDQLLFEVALCTGYRRGELTALKVKDFDATTLTLSLPVALTKGRKDARQPLPETLAAKLAEYVRGKEPDAALLVMPKRPQERLYRVMKLANVQRIAAGGKILPCFEDRLRYLGD